MTSSTDISKQTETGSKRTHERILLVSYLRVFDADTGLLLGHVADISFAGIKLVSLEPLELNKTYALKLILPKEVLGRSDLLFYAESCWTKPDSNPDFIVTGFRFPSLSGDQRDQIEAIHDAFGRDTVLSPATSEQPACNLTPSTGR